MQCFLPSKWVGTGMISIDPKGKRKDFSRRSTRPESGRKLAKRKKKKNLLRSVRLNLVLAGGIACDEQDGKGMIANDERERKKGKQKKGN